MKGKTRSFTFRIDAEVFAALEQSAAAKEWSVGHLVNSILTNHVGKPAKANRPKPTKRQPKPAALGLLDTPAAQVEPVAE